MNYVDRSFSPQRLCFGRAVASAASFGGMTCLMHLFYMFKCKNNKNPYNSNKHKRWLYVLTAGIENNDVKCRMYKGCRQKAGYKTNTLSCFAVTKLVCDKKTKRAGGKSMKQCCPKKTQITHINSHIYAGSEFRNEIHDVLRRSKAKRRCHKIYHCIYRLVKVFSPEDNSFCKRIFFRFLHHCPSS